MFLIDPSKALNILNNYAYVIQQQSITFNVHYWGIDPFHLKNPLHKHSFFEICYVIEGAGIYIDEGIQFPLEKGTLFCSRPEIWHQIHSQTEMFLVYVAFEVDPANTSSEMSERFNTLYRTNCFIIHNSENSATALLWRALIQQFLTPELIIKENIISIAQSLLLSFYTTFTEHNEQTIQLPKGKSSVHLLNQAKAFIRDNLSQPLHLDIVADYLHVSGRHLSRLFTEETGQNYVTFVQSERIRSAANLLTLTNDPIKDISEKVGFNSVHYFTKTFSSIMRMPPAMYRSKHDSQITSN
jgi:AraC-like DNA-binding protein/mannose-6-phosphate isomerase-like protein (cupin superfamily)